MPLRKSFITFVISLLLFTGLAAQANETFLRDFQGQPASIGSYTGNGKWLAVMFWASDCHVCNVEAKNYADFHNRHHNRDASILGVSLDGTNKAAAEQFIRRHKLTFPNLIGESDLVALQYTSLVGETAFGTPSFLLYNPQGELVASQLGAVRVEKIEAFIDSHSKP